MKNTDSSQILPIPIAKASNSDLIPQLSDTNFQLRQVIEKQAKVIDKITNSLAMQEELIQQLRSKIASLKGQKSKPRIPRS